MSGLPDIASSTSRNVGTPIPCLGRDTSGGRQRREPVPGVDAGELFRRSLRDRSSRVRRPLEGRVVVDDDDAVAREVDVELEPIGAERQAVIERDDGVFGPQGPRRPDGRRREDAKVADNGSVYLSWQLPAGAGSWRCKMPYDLGTSLHTWRTALGGAGRPACRAVRVKDEIRDNLIARLRANEHALSGHHRLRRNRRAADRQCRPVAP